MRTIQRNIVAALIISKDDRYLLGQKNPAQGGAYSNGHWLLPGGGIDEGEDQRTALLREIREETNLDLSDTNPQLVNRGEGESEKTLKDTGERVLCQMQFFDYVIELSQNAEDVPLSPTEELPVLRWVTREELTNLTLSPPLTAMLQKLGYLS